MVFKLASTFPNPAAGAGLARGMPSPGAGAQTTGPGRPQPNSTVARPLQPTIGRRTWFRPGSLRGSARGMPQPLNAAQRRPVDTMNNYGYDQTGLPTLTWTPYFSRGADAWAPTYGKVFTNPIGAGIQVLHRPQASYGGAAQYANGALWWTSQTIPTSINLQGLTDPQVLADQLGDVLVQAVVRTTG